MCKQDQLSPTSKTPALKHSLMAVGFGDAGAEIIADNMRSGGDLNPMVPGQKVTAIFGFCDVRQFTDTTEILQVRLLPRLSSTWPAEAGRLSVSAQLPSERASESSAQQFG